MALSYFLTEIIPRHNFVISWWNKFRLADGDGDGEKKEKVEDENKEEATS